MAMRGDITADSLSKLAEAYGLDITAIVDRMDAPEVINVLAQTAQLAQALQISGTPTFVYEDQMVRGYIPLDQLQAITEQLRSN